MSKFVRFFRNVLIFVVMFVVLVAAMEFHFVALVLAWSAVTLSANKVFEWVNRDRT